MRRGCSARRGGAGDAIDPESRRCRHVVLNPKRRFGFLHLVETREVIHVRGEFEDDKPVALALINRANVWPRIAAVVQRVESSAGPHMRRPCGEQKLACAAVPRTHAAHLGRGGVCYRCELEEAFAVGDGVAEAGPRAERRGELVGAEVACRTLRRGAQLR